MSTTDATQQAGYWIEVSETGRLGNVYLCTERRLVRGHRVLEEMTVEPESYRRISQEEAKAAWNDAQSKHVWPPEQAAEILARAAFRVKRGKLVEG